MDKKTIIAVVILGIVLIFYFQIMEFLGLYTPPEPQPITQQQEQVDSSIVAAQPGTQQVPINMADQTAQTDISETAINVIADSVAQDTIIVETNKYIVTLTSFGGGPVSLKLKDYSYRNGEMIEMIPDANSATPEVTFAGGTYSTSTIPFTSNLQPGNYDAYSSPLEFLS